MNKLIGLGIVTALLAANSSGANQERKTNKRQGVTN